jgi:hypothetical protein
MDEWQPARLIDVHTRVEEFADEYIEESAISDLLHKTVFVRPLTNLNSFEISHLRRECDCPNGERFYEVRRDSLPGGDVVCEHECLTD